MGLAAIVLPEFEKEMANTRVALERVPEDKLEWRPHPKSMTLGRLAGHLAELPGWAASALKVDQLDLAPEGKPAGPACVMTSRKQALDIFDPAVAEVKRLLADVSDERLGEPWTLSYAGKRLFSLPRLAVVRTWAISHTIHHRGQLTVYLRLNDVPVPSLYGPSADENPMT
jgi:uncharacterized damage-inducible protein DinB